MYIVIITISTFFHFHKLIIDQFSRNILFAKHTQFIPNSKIILINSPINIINQRESLTDFLLASHFIVIYLEYIFTLCLIFEGTLLINPLLKLIVVVFFQMLKYGKCHSYHLFLYLLILSNSSQSTICRERFFIHLILHKSLKSVLTIIRCYFTFFYWNRFNTDNFRNELTCFYLSPSRRDFSLADL